MLQVVLSGVSSISKLARHFNGTSDYLVSATNVDLSSATVVSVAFRMKWDAFGNDDKLAMELSVDENSNSGAFYIDPNGTIADDFQVITRSSNSSSWGFHLARPSAGVWHDYLVVIDGRTASSIGSSAVYIDGQIQTISGYNAIVNNGTTNFGAYPLYVMSRAGGSLFGAGSMCDLAIWKADESANVAAILDFSTDITTVDSANLLYYWPFKQVSPETPNAGAVNLTVIGTTNDTDP